MFQLINSLSQPTLWMPKGTTSVRMTPQKMHPGNQREKKKASKKSEF